MQALRPFDPGGRRRISRRDLLASAAGAGAIAPLRGWAQGGGAQDFAALLDGFFEETLNEDPETATQLGLDRGARAALASRLNDHSAAGVAAARALNRSQIERLAAVNRAALTPADKVSYDTIDYDRRADAALLAFDFGGSNFSASPYVVSQLTGAYQSTPNFLDTKHRIETAADAQAYLARLEAYAGQLDGDTERMVHDGALGVTPPDFLLDTTLTQMTASRVGAARSVLVISITQRAARKGLSARYGEEAARIYEAAVLPALDRQIAQARRMRPGASSKAGVGRLKEGPQFYAAALRATTTTSLTPDEIHQFGLDQARDISGRMDVLLRAKGLTRGSVGERVAALNRDPAQLFPNTDAGKAQAIAYCNARLDAIRPHLPSRFKRLPPYAFEVRRVPLETEAGSALAYSQGPALDGSRPGLVYFNLHDTAEWPKWTLPTTVYHEGLPGHQLQGGLARSLTSLPMIRKTVGFSGYSEGWALYAEQLADEMGMYEDDPLGRIGFLKGQLFRAGRCVVDTGIHHLDWSREQAIDYMTGLTGDARGYVVREVERYCTQPGQACAYKLGHRVWLGARGRAQAALGARFDIRDFHAAGIDCGSVPLDVLDGVIDGWTASMKA